MTKQQGKTEEIVRKWMFCLNSLDLCLNSKYSMFIPDPIYILLNDLRLDLEFLFAYYEDMDAEEVKGET